MVAIIKLFGGLGLAVALTVQVSAAPLQNRHLETAAAMNVAENICGLHYEAGRGSLVDHVMQGAAEMGISVTRAAALADERAKDILYSVTTSNRKKSFCRNAKSGKF